MPNNRKSMQRRKNLRAWVDNDPSRPEGFWYANQVKKEDHGTWSTYNNWYCRCTPCMHANTERWMESYYLKDTHGYNSAANIRKKNVQKVRPKMGVVISGGASTYWPVVWTTMVRNRRPSSPRRMVLAWDKARARP